MARMESATQALKLIPFLQPSNHAPRLVLTQWPNDASYPFAVVDDSAPFSRIMRGSFRTAAGSRLMDVFLIVQRDQYLLKDSSFSTLTNQDVEICWQNVLARNAATAGDDALIELSPQTDDSSGLVVFAPLLFCREKQLFLPLLCPSCGSEFELCRDDELLQKKGLHPYGTSVRRYLYCPVCNSSGKSEFYVREREDADPLFIFNCEDLIDRLRLLAGKEVANGTLLCASCDERDTCFGTANSVRRRLLPFSFYPFHMLIVAAPELNALDFSSLLSGGTAVELAEEIDNCAFPGRFASLNDLEDTGPVTWTNFTKGDERAFSELLFLKLSLLEEIVGRAATKAITPPRGENVWVYLPKICRNLPLGWNFRHLFTDDITPLPFVHELEQNPLLLPAQSGLLYFQVLLSNREVSGSRVIDAVRQYLADNGDDSLLRSLCVSANIFRDPVGHLSSRQQEECWTKACATGFDLLDAARGRASLGLAEIHRSMRILTDEARDLLFSTKKVENSPVGTVSNIAVDDNQAQLTIRQVIADMISRCRAELLERPSATPDDRSDEIVETIILRTGASSEPLVTQNAQLEESATVIIPFNPPVMENTVDVIAATEEELNETVMIGSSRPANQCFEPTPPQPPASEPQTTAPEQEQDELAETVMIIPPAGRNRPGGSR